jgi:hypothetical protein
MADASLAKPACTAPPTRAPDLPPPTVGTLVRDDVLRRAPRLDQRPRNPPGTRGPPKSPARPLPTSIPLGKRPHSAASPIALRPARPPDRSFFSRHPKRSKAIASARSELPRGPAARSVAPQTPRGIHGPPRSRAHRNPRSILAGKPPRCVAGTIPHPLACPLRNNAALHHPTSSARSLRLREFPRAVQTPPGSKPGIRDPPKFRLRHSPTNNPAGKPRRWSVFPAPRPLASPLCNNFARRHPKSSQSAFRHSHSRRSSAQTPPGIHGPPRSRARRLPMNILPGKPRHSPASPSSHHSACLPGRIACDRHPKSTAPPGPSPLPQKGTPSRQTQSAFAKFACSSPSPLRRKTKTVRLRQRTATPHEPQSIYCRRVADNARVRFPSEREGKHHAQRPIISSKRIPG